MISVERTGRGGTNWLGTNWFGTKPFWDELVTVGRTGLERTGFGTKRLVTDISILLYADDIVLIAENEQNLQEMLNFMYNWWKLKLNINKSNVIHFRNKRARQSNLCSVSMVTNSFGLNFTYTL